MKQMLFLVVFLVVFLVCFHVGDSVKDLSDLPSLGVITVKEGESVVIKCNMSELHENIQWFDSKGRVINSGALFSLSV